MITSQEREGTSEPDNSGGIPEAAENAVTPLVWACRAPGHSQQAQPVSITLKPGSKLAKEATKYLREKAQIMRQFFKASVFLAHPDEIGDLVASLQTVSDTSWKELFHASNF
ncbi:hypothetical protein HGM15179_018144 [Zosterops borbonicus]|uniref:Uncharacterized protein n=1 Tax=Zosterops borbonicus TaxID=364589 RepID=A0A8K1FZL8_9PASS|nr:hypothetical protein HGM15179_018144 [Zosterops borbonicus]